MSCLVDAFIIITKPNYRMFDDEPASVQALAEELPSRYRPLFMACCTILQEKNPGLWPIECAEGILKDCGALEDAVEQRCPEEVGNVQFADRFRGACLKQALRHTFFDTLLICEGVYNEGKTNLYYILPGEPVPISEDTWGSTLSDDEKMVRGVARDLEDAGFQVYKSFEDPDKDPGPMTDEDSSR